MFTLLIEYVFELLAIANKFLPDCSVLRSKSIVLSLVSFLFTVFDLIVSRLVVYMVLNSNEYILLSAKVVFEINSKA